MGFKISSGQGNYGSLGHSGSREFSRKSKMVCWRLVASTALLERKKMYAWLNIIFIKKANGAHYA